MTIGAVSTLMTWYVPMVLCCSERFVKTTKPQYVSDNGIILTMFKRLNLNTSNCKQMSRPIKVIKKWMNVSVMFGKPKLVNMCLLSKTIAIDEIMFTSMTVTVCIWSRILWFFGSSPPADSFSNRLWFSTASLEFSFKEMSTLVIVMFAALCDIDYLLRFKCFKYLQLILENKKSRSI